MPVVASYCADFLKADMQHIYRQLSDLSRWEARVMTHRRDQAELFPWPEKKLRVLPKSVWRWPRRLWHRSVMGRPHLPPTLGEVKEFLYQVRRFEAQVLHIYFGHQPFSQPEPKRFLHATGIDTGCVFGGWLSAVEISNEGVRHIAVPANKTYAIKK